MTDVPEGALENLVFKSGSDAVYFSKEGLVVGDKRIAYDDFDDFVKGSDNEYTLMTKSTGECIELTIDENGEKFEEMIVNYSVDEDSDGEDEDEISSRPDEGGAMSPEDREALSQSLPSISDHLQMEEEKAVEEQILRDEEDRLKRELEDAKQEMEDIKRKEDEKKEDVISEPPKEEVPEDTQKEEEKTVEEEKPASQPDVDDDDDEYDAEIERMLRQEAEKKYQEELRKKRGENLSDEGKEETTTTEEPEKAEEEKVADDDDLVKLQELLQEDEPKEEPKEAEKEEETKEEPSEQEQETKEEEENEEEKGEETKESEEPPKEVESTEDDEEDDGLDFLEMKTADDILNQLEQELEEEVETENNEEEEVEEIKTETPNDEKVEEPKEALPEEEESVEKIIEEVTKEPEEEEEPVVVVESSSSPSRITGLTDDEKQSSEFKWTKEIYDIFESHYLYPKSSQRLFSLSKLKNRVIKVTDDTIMDDKTLVSLMLESLLINKLDPKIFKMFTLEQEHNQDVLRWRVLKMKSSSSSSSQTFFMGTESQGVLDTVSSAIFQKPNDMEFPCSFATSKHYALNPLMNNAFEFRLDDQALFYGTLIFEVEASDVKNIENDGVSNAFDKLFGECKFGDGFEHIKTFKDLEKQSTTNQVKLKSIRYRFSYYHPSTYFYFCDDDSIPPFFELNRKGITKSEMKDLDYEYKSSISYLRSTLSSEEEEEQDERKIKSTCEYLEKVVRLSLKNRKVLDLNVQYFVSLWNILRKLLKSPQPSRKLFGLRLFQTILENNKLMDSVFFKPENTLYLEETLYLIFSSLKDTEEKEILNLTTELTHEFVGKYVRDVDQIMVNFVCRQLNGFVSGKNKSLSQLVLLLRMIHLIFFTKKNFFTRPRINVLLSHLKNVFEMMKESRIRDEIINVFLNLYYFGIYAKEYEEEDEDGAEEEFEMTERKRMVVCLFAGSSTEFLQYLLKSLRDRVSN